MANRNFPDDNLQVKKSKESYTVKVFNESTVSVISAILSTASTPRKALKTIVLLICLMGFLYQTSVFIYYVLQYETVLNIDIEKPKFYEVPAYTFCDNNGIGRKVFCSKFPDRCFQPSEEFCKAFPFYCDVNKTLVPRKEYYFMELDMSTKEISEFSKNLSELLVGDINDINEKVTGPFLWPKNADDPGRTACYSLHLLVDSPLEPKKEAVSPLVKDPVNRLKFAVEEHDSFLPHTRPGILFAIHSPFQAVNPFMKGYFLKPGRTYNIHISMNKEVLLPYPYETDCMNYTKQWEARNRSGVRTQEMCQYKCVYDSLMENYGCIFGEIVYPNTAPICKDDVGRNITENADFVENILNCIDECKDDCSKTRYSPVIQERFTVKYDEKGEISEDSQRHIYVNIFLDEEEVIVYRRRPQYKGVEVYSNIGGFIGVWLGVSLVQLMDFFETMGRIIIHFFKKKLKS